MLKVIFLMLLVVCFYSCEEDKRTINTMDSLYYEAFYMDGFPSTYRENFAYYRSGNEWFKLNDTLIKCECITNVNVTGFENTTRGLSVMKLPSGPLDSLKFKFVQFSNEHGVNRYNEYFYKDWNFALNFTSDLRFGTVGKSVSNDGLTISYVYDKDKLLLTKTMLSNALTQIDSIHLPKRLVFKKNFGLISIEFQDGKKLEWAGHAD